MDAVSCMRLSVEAQSPCVGFRRELELGKGLGDTATQWHGASHMQGG